MPSSKTIVSLRNKNKKIVLETILHIFTGCFVNILIFFPMEHSFGWYDCTNQKHIWRPLCRKQGQFALPEDVYKSNFFSALILAADTII